MKQILSAFCLLGSANASVSIDPMFHDIQLVNSRNFDTVISKFRDFKVSMVWFFKHNADNADFLDTFNGYAKRAKGMVTVAAVDCDEGLNKDFCSKHSVGDKPHVHLFPISPEPDYKYAGDLDAPNRVLNHAFSKIPNNAETLDNSKSADEFLAGHISKPKVILYSDKKLIPTLFKALSSDTVFQRSIRFGFISTVSTPDLPGEHGVKKFPTIRMENKNVKLSETYKGDLSFTSLHEWINRFSESGMGMGGVGSTSVGSEETNAEDLKPWLNQEFPQLTKESHNEVCFKRGEGLCVILLTDSSTLSKAHETMLSDLKSKFTSQIADRGTKLRWMWLDAKTQQNWHKLFQPATLPGVVVFNPFKRLRWVKPEVDEDAGDRAVAADGQVITDLIEKILGGDARFKMVRAKDGLPKWIDPVDAAAGKKEEL